MAGERREKALAPSFFRTHNVCLWCTVVHFAALATEASLEEDDVEAAIRG
jgi:hypothetical protein